MNLSESETLGNLEAAFTREAIAGNRLRWFAELADVEGQPELARAFRSVAEASKGQAFGVLEFLHDGGGDAAENLVDALVEQREAHAAYVEAGKRAGAEGFDDIAEWFDQMATARARHIAKLEGPKSD